jgi:tripartite ATP-independent transporter DctM subunit
VNPSAAAEDASTVSGGGPSLLASPLTAIANVLDFCAQAVLVCSLLGELGAVLANIAARTFFETSFVWADEIARLSLSTLAFVGGTLAYRRRHHSFISVVLDRLPQPLRLASLALADLLVLLLAMLIAGTSLTLVEASWDDVTPILHMSGAAVVLPLTVSMMLLVLFAAEHLWREHRLRALVIGGGLAALIALAIVTRPIWSPHFTGNVPVSLSLLLFFVSTAGGLPVSFSLLLSTASFLWITNTAPLVELPHNMVTGTGNFVLLALPFFIVAGLVMERGGISSRLIHFIHALVGHLRGGLLQVTVVSMYLVSGLSGSKSADVAAVGSVMRDMLKRENYAPAECAAVLAASAAMGETVPPSIAILVLGSITSLSMAALFIGGIVPAAVIAVCLMAMIYGRARWSRTPRVSRSSLRAMLRAGRSAILPLLMPVALFAGILLGVATPTEVSGIAIFYGLILAVGLYREMDLRDFLRVLIDSAVLAGMVLFILAAAQGFSWILTMAYVPQRLVELLHGVHDSMPLFLVGSVILLIVAGSLLEGLPAINILAPLLLPIAEQIGVNRLHYGIVLIIAMGIGAFLPPTGVGFYVCCAVARTDIESASRAMIPYLAILIVGVLIVTFVPWFTLFLPEAFGFRG